MHVRIARSVQYLHFCVQYVLARPRTAHDSGNSQKPQTNTVIVGGHDIFASKQAWVVEGVEEKEWANERGKGTRAAGDQI